KTLGINALYLNPIFRAQTNHRYDTTDYFQIDPALGDLGVFHELVKQVHSRKMHIILDGVFNHCGIGFAPFIDVMKKGGNSTYANWFYPQSFPLSKESVNYLSCGGCAYLPKLNHDNPEVTRFILEVAKYWTKETKIDGWRLDVPFKIKPVFWREFRQVVKNINPQAYMVGEVWREADSWIQGDTFNGVTNYRLKEIILDYVLTHVLDAEDFGYELDTLLSAHGQNRVGMLNLLGSHDTERIYTKLQGNVDLLRIALTIQMTLPGIPMIYYGDEVGLTGENDPGCRRCIPWDESQWNQQIYQDVSRLISLRHQHPALSHGIPQQLGFYNGMFAYKQQYQNDEVIIVTNPREEARDVVIPTQSENKHWIEYFSHSRIITPEKKLAIDHLPARSAKIFILD
ncbi:MAG: glycoside hydrolase family 13 protein, partial [Anaerolineaceae bacterium]